MQFVGTLRSMYPQFAQQGPRGGYMQQDAEEFYNTMVQSLAQGLESGGRSMKSLLGFELEESLSCAESEAEGVVVRNESVNKLVCNIQGGMGSQVTVDHLQEGLKLALEGTVEKNSQVLGRNAIWNKQSKIASLPRYLCVQFMRFFWKATPESMDHQGVKCKIMRPVSYPEVHFK
jgi:ubiquitin carboxyl-terminal hydrolase 14